MGYFVSDLSFHIFCLGSSFGIFGLVSFVWIFRLSSFAWGLLFRICRLISVAEDLSFGSFGLGPGPLVWDRSFGTLGLASFAWDPSCGIV